MDCEVCSVSLDRIDTADPTFKITTNTDPTDLALSISVVGLLQPPILIEKGNGYTTVAGFRRIAACKVRKLKRVPARLIPPEFPKLTCAQMAVADNALQRPLNLIEKSRAYALLQRFAGHSPIWLNMAESVGLDSSASALDRILPVAGMPPGLQEALLEGSIAHPIALAIDRLSPDDRLALCGFFRQINTGLNVQRELLTLISDISLRDDLSVAGMLAGQELTAIMENPDLPLPQKVQALRRVLKKKRYPELSRAETVYHQERKSLKLHPRIQLQPPPFFEGRSYRLTLTIESRRQLQSILSDLEKLARHPGLLPE